MVQVATEYRVRYPMPFQGSHGVNLFSRNLVVRFVSVCCPSQGELPISDPGVHRQRWQPGVASRRVPPF
ncbi:hypothetical protein NRB56_28050 [Nocardia sp. RB56]|uniref:Uncharacterized protein n=1 Tax=Nocardia aurantia TaxID=2585199 RepID=A0A7K0DPA9_9NOCA|nr:hypothetical protein [Nocardia aurantia]